MADYNVNMKQWNGSSFDNVLPLAFNSKALDGKSYDDIIQYVQNHSLDTYLGSYVGTGTYGQSNPTSITFPFKPDMVILPMTSTARDNNNQSRALIPIIVDSISTDYRLSPVLSDISMYIKRSEDGKTFSLYSSSYSDYQQNLSNATYYYLGIGKVNYADEFTFTSSGSFTIPRTGRYYLELYGGGGSSSYNSHWVGGSSCQTFDSITLTKGDVINMTVGKANSGAIDGTTKFGQYSVQGATTATSSAVGNGAGNKGKDGWYDQNNSVYNYSDGELGERFGFGRNSAAAAGSGAVYLKYLGE